MLSHHSSVRVLEDRNPRSDLHIRHHFRRHDLEAVSYDLHSRRMCATLERRVKYDFVPVNFL